MLNRIKNLLGSRTGIEKSDEKERIQVATCVLLLEMAWTDSDFHELESLLIRNLLQRRFDLSPESAGELMAIAQERRESSPDLYEFTRQINENFSPEEKLGLMESLWHLVYADGVLDKYEDALMRKTAALLRLSHREMIDAKLRVLNEIRSGR